MFRDNNTFDDNNFLRVTLNTLSTTNEYFKTFQTMKTTWFLYFTDLTYSTFNKNLSFRESWNIYLLFAPAPTFSANKFSYFSPLLYEHI